MATHRDREWRAALCGVLTEMRRYCKDAPTGPPDDAAPTDVARTLRPEIAALKKRGTPSKGAPMPSTDDLVTGGCCDALLRLLDAAPDPVAEQKANVTNWYYYLREAVRETAQYTRGIPAMPDTPQHLDDRTFAEVEPWLRPAMVAAMQRNAGASMEEKIVTGLCQRNLKALDRFPFAGALGLAC